MQVQATVASPCRCQQPWATARL